MVCMILRYAWASSVLLQLSGLREHCSHIVSGAIYGGLHFWNHNAPMRWDAKVIMRAQTYSGITESSSYDEVLVISSVWKSIKGRGTM